MVRQRAAVEPESIEGYLHLNNAIKFGNRVFDSNAQLLPGRFVHGALGLKQNLILQLSDSAPQNSTC